MTLDWTKPLQTRGGRAARVLGRVRSDKYPVVVAVYSDTGMECVGVYTEDGSLYVGGTDDPLNIINVPPAPVYGYARVFEAKEKTADGEGPWFGPTMPTLQDVRNSTAVPVYAKHIGFVKLGVQDGKVVSVEAVE